MWLLQPRLQISRQPVTRVSSTVYQEWETHETLEKSNKYTLTDNFYTYLISRTNTILRLHQTLPHETCDCLNSGLFTITLVVDYPLFSFEDITKYNWTIQLTNFRALFHRMHALLSPAMRSLSTTRSFSTVCILYPIAMKKYLGVKLQYGPAVDDTRYLFGWGVIQNEKWYSVIVREKNGSVRQPAYISIFAFWQRQTQNHFLSQRKTIQCKCFPLAFVFVW